MNDRDLNPAVTAVVDEIGQKRWDALKSTTQYRRTSIILVAVCTKKLRSVAALALPEARLFFSVLSTGIKDAQYGTEPQIKSARRYFRLKNHHIHCEVCGLDPEYVDDVLRMFFSWGGL